MTLEDCERWPAVAWAIRDVDAQANMHTAAWHIDGRAKSARKVRRVLRRARHATSTRKAQ